MKSNPVRVDIYKVISRAVEEGIAYGYMRSHKHTNTPSEELLKEEIFNGVMNELSDYIVWEPE